MDLHQTNPRGRRSPVLFGGGSRLQKDVFLCRVRTNDQEIREPENPAPQCRTGTQVGKGKRGGSDFQPQGLPIDRRRGMAGHLRQARCLRQLRGEHCPVEIADWRSGDPVFCRSGHVLRGTGRRRRHEAGCKGHQRIHSNHHEWIERIRSRNLRTLRGDPGRGRTIQFVHAVPVVSDVHHCAERRHRAIHCRERTKRARCAHGGEADHHLGIGRCRWRCRGDVRRQCIEKESPGNRGKRTIDSSRIRQGTRGHPSTIVRERRIGRHGCSCCSATQAFRRKRRRGWQGRGQGHCLLVRCEHRRGWHHQYL
mmetsp:Transcript_4606/g.13267  ORF Transcript_4606/g.13267 Transcript_4606/m.13267 type:complete len:309 (-) Transcript_4606:384-1310(-)